MKKTLTVCITGEDYPHAKFPIIKESMSIFIVIDRVWTQKDVNSYTLT